MAFLAWGSFHHKTSAATGTMNTSGCENPNPRASSAVNNSQPFCPCRCNCLSTRKKMSTAKKISALYCFNSLEKYTKRLETLPRAKAVRALQGGSKAWTRGHKSNSVPNPKRQEVRRSAVSLRPNTCTIPHTDNR